MPNPTQQSFELIKKSKEILVVLPAQASGDAVGSAIALSLALKKMDKIVTLGCSSTLPTKFSFLSDADKFILKIDAPRVFELAISKSGSKISQVKYENTDATLKFLLTTQGTIDSTDINLKSGRFIYDLIICVDSPDLESLGEIYNQNPELFFNTPILNIDYKGANDQFGEANLIDLNASSTSEIVFSLIESMGSGLFDQNIATALMTGLISKTKNFQQSTNPKIFLLAGSLANFGANQDKITNALFTQKNITSLKLLGKILSNGLDFDEEKKYVIGELQKNSLQNPSVSNAEISLAFNNLADYFNNCSIKSLLYEGQNNSVLGIVSSANQKIIEKIQVALGGNIKNDELFFEVPGKTLISVKDSLKHLIFQEA